MEQVGDEGNGAATPHNDEAAVATAVTRPERQAKRRQPAASGDSTTSDDSVISRVPNHKAGRHVVYEQYPDAYDALMSRHDCTRIAEVLMREASRLQTVLGRKLVIGDLGCGTGRIALMLTDAASTFVMTDAARPMLLRCADRLRALPGAPYRVALNGQRLASGGGAENGPAAELRVCTFEDFAIPSDVEVACNCAECAAAGGFEAAPPTLQPRAWPLVPDVPPMDLVVCGWSLSFVMTALWGTTRWHSNILRAVSAMVCALDPAVGGTVCIVETLGNWSETPVRKSSLHTYLSDVLGFTMEWRRTDYRFRTPEEASRCVTFFFGGKPAMRLAETSDPCTLLECTGVWTRHFPPPPAAVSTAPAAAAA